MATYVIGDVHGCFEPLQRLMAQIRFNPSHDELWFSGDLINRGPQSLQTLRWVKALGSSAKVVLGNHDLHLLAIYYGDHKQKRKDTLDDILRAPDVASLLNWLRRQPLCHTDSQHRWCLTHAGVPHIWDIETTKRLAQEAHECLSSDQCTEFFQHMYGNQPAVWHDDLSGVDRIRVIVNYLTRMRFIANDGTLDFKAKDNMDDAPKGFAPWFRHPRSQATDTTFLFGHWAALQGQTHLDGYNALDTGCVWGGELTALCLDDQTYHRVPASI